MPLRRIGHARHPIRIGELSRQIVSLLELEIDGRGLTGRDIGRADTVEVKAGGADCKRVVARCEPGCRKAVVAVGVGDDGDPDGRAVLAGADQDPFQGALLG